MLLLYQGADDWGGEHLGPEHDQTGMHLENRGSPSADYYYRWQEWRTWLFHLGEMG